MSEGNANEKPGPLDRFRKWHAKLDPLGRQRLHAALGLSLVLVALVVFFKSSGAAFPAEVGIVLLLMGSHWWVGWAFAPKVETPPRIGRPISKLSIFFLLGALILATCLRLPLMDRHLLIEEHETVSRHIHGHTELGADGSEAWQPADGSAAARDNPILLSVTAKASLGIWRKFTGLPEDRFHPVPIRLPSLLAGLGAIFLIWRLLHWFGYRCAGLFAAFYLAIHPAAIDYHVQASGDSLCLFFELLAIASVYLALRTLQWRFWILYAASLLLCLSANPAAIFFAVGISLFLAIYLLRRIARTKTRAAARPQFVRFAVANLIATFMFLPTLVLAGANSHEGAGREWAIAGVWDHLTAGDLIVAPLLLLFGTFHLARGNRFATPLVFGGLVAPLLGYAHWLLAPDLWSNAWSISYALPIFTVLFAIGITSLSEFFKNKPLRPYITLAIGTTYLIVFSIVCDPEPAKQPPVQQQGEVEFVEFQRGDSRWRVYPDGKMTRESGIFIDKPSPTAR